jgi:hypothetical protein
VKQVSFRFYGDDWLGSKVRLGCAPPTQCTYIAFICLCMQSEDGVVRNGKGEPIDGETLKTLLSTAILDRTAVKAALDELTEMGCIDLFDGGFSNPRCREVARERAKYHADRVQAGQQGGKGKAKVSQSSAKDKPKPTPSLSESESESLSESTTLVPEAGTLGDAGKPSPPPKETFDYPSLLTGIIEAWNRTMDTYEREAAICMPRAGTATPTLISALRARCRERTIRKRLDHWTAIIARIPNIAFLSGRGGSKGGGKAFRASLPWLLTAKSRLVKLEDGIYSEDQQDPDIWDLPDPRKGLSA